MKRRLPKIENMRRKLPVISLSIDCITFRESNEKIIEWASKKMPSFVCFANVHMVIEAYKDPAFLSQLNRANLVLADGQPLAQACKLLYNIEQERICGMDFLPAILKEAEARNLTVFFFGSTDEILTSLESKIRQLHPRLLIAGKIAPPFRPFNEHDLESYINTINRLEPNIVLVSLGCPKQEKWMAENSPKINSVLLGVGGAFPVMAGKRKRAPRWMQKMSLEWLFRLAQEPGRLFARYLVTNSRFLLLLFKEKLKLL